MNFFFFWNSETKITFFIFWKTDRKKTSSQDLFHRRLHKKKQFQNFLAKQKIHFSFFENGIFLNRKKKLILSACSIESCTKKTEEKKMQRKKKMQTKKNAEEKKKNADQKLIKQRKKKARNQLNFQAFVANAWDIKKKKLPS